MTIFRQEPDKFIKTGVFRVGFLTILLEGCSIDIELNQYVVKLSVFHNYTHIPQVIHAQTKQRQQLSMQQFSSTRTTGSEEQVQNGVRRSRREA